MRIPAKSLPHLTPDWRHNCGQHEQLMRRLSLWLLPMAVWAGQSRYARVGDFDGSVEVQIQAADAWEPVLRNMPLGELAWLRTEGSSRVELELDDGSVLRLGGDSLAELSDYTRLSTGQRITLISLDRGLAYFTGAAEGKDALMLAVPGAQVAIHRGARLRLEAREQWSQIAAGEGAARFSSPTAEFDLEEGQMARLDPAHPARFFLYREISPLDTDRWSDERDKVLASTGSAAHVPQLRYGVADLDANGVWIQSSDFGAVWKPKMPEAWVPFRNGKWRWYDGLGYTWISDDSWGWLPYHYGRWIEQEGTGWVWAPSRSTVFKPGEVYWLKSAKLVGWGPLAPGEEWKPPSVPRLFLNANTTYADYAPEAHRDRSGGFLDASAGAIGDCGLYGGTAVARVPGRPFGSAPPGAARRQHAHRTGSAWRDFRGAGGCSGSSCAGLECRRACRRGVPKRTAGSAACGGRDQPAGRGSRCSLLSGAGLHGHHRGEAAAAQSPAAG